MGTRAIIVVRDDTGGLRRFWAAWASKQYQIPHLARLVHAADQDGSPLSVAGYTAWAGAHPGTLPGQDITDTGWYADPEQTGDLDHRYDLWLRDTDRTLRYLIYDRGPLRTRWQLAEDLGTRAQLYEAAARMCARLADTTRRYAERHGGVVPAGWPGPQGWHEQQRTFTAWLAGTDAQLLHRPGPAAEPVPTWFAVRAARAQSQRIRGALREQYPGLNIRARAGADGVISLTVPADLADGAEPARIADLIGDLLGRAFTVAVRAHRRSRHTGHDGQSRQAAVNATLTLHPHCDAAAVTGTTGDAAGEDSGS